MHVFMLFGKEPDESAIVKRNIDQDIFCQGEPPNFYFDLDPTQTLGEPVYDCVIL